MNANATLIVTAPYREGLVICADKRTYDTLRGDRDTETKIVQLGAKGAFSSTGTKGFLALPSLKELWRADTVTSEFYAQSEVSPGTLPTFFQNLATSYKKYLDSIPYRWWPESAFEPPTALFQIIFYSAEKEGLIKIFGLQFLYRKAIVPEMKAATFETPTSFANAFGNTAVYNEIKAGTNPTFERFRKEPLLRSFVIERRPASKVTKSTAVRFAKRLILVTSENTLRIEDSTYHVGPTCDCASIEPKTGFQWIAAK